MGIRASRIRPLPTVAIHIGSWRRAVVIHGDFTPWNIRYARGTLSAVLDFEMAHLDLRVADFALSWRGHHDDVVRGYEEVSRLEPVEQELLVPIY